MAVLGVVVLLVGFALSGGNLELLKSLIVKDMSNEELSNQLRSFGWRGYIATTALSALQIVCTFLPAEPIQVISGFALGFPVGLLCCMLGVLLGNTLIYMLQNIFGERLRSFFLNKLKLDLEKVAQSTRGVIIILILYLLPVIPYGVICFIAASMGMSYRRFILVTCVGALPSVCVGVGLGYIAIVSNNLILLCALGILILIAIVIFSMRDRLLSKLNKYAGEHRRANSNKVQTANTFMLNFLYFCVRVYMVLCGVKIKTVNKVGKPNTPAIVLCNHGSFIDFIYATALLRKSKPHFIVARLYFYNKKLGWALRKVGAFPKSMFAMDMENAKNCLTVLKNKELLAMMPEARLSTAGKFEDIQETTYSFVKKSGVDVYTVKICGDYLADPKWGRGFRRGSLVEAELDILYTAQLVQDMSLEELKKGIEQRLTYDEFQWLQQRSDIHYRSSHLAEGLENILSVCPICNKKYTLTTKKNQVFCEHCGHLTSLNDRYGFDEGFRFANLSQWYDWQMDLLKAEIAANQDYTLSSEVELRLPGDGKSLTRHGGYGVCRLNRDGLTYSGTKDGETVELHFSIQRIYRLLFGAGENFEIYDGAQILYFVPSEKRSAVEWYMTSLILNNEGGSV